ncbi:5'-methylthioadenosine/S-adenosylhomocysteine nucleosidase [Methanosarcina sp. UBA289]|uniref:5'-methylthioadenosine/S-adenosylhomocysteine nucleosidase family protein n=1 Tax=Methanosarcina sp. UBA289 TaxID=1915574 RepID=UPI0025EE1BD8|nr:5'-methylthioadenosine/S-adenosylhomocysteine nucleosidase [Methanosarcina sp. UBA289]
MPRFKEEKKCVAVILTALPVEYLAVRDHLTDIEEKTHPQGTIYECGIFSTNGQLWNVAIGEIGEGNEQAALEVERAVSYFDPSIIIFVGVAGGVKDDVKLGDVVVASKVYCYESGKAGNNFKTRPQVSSPNYKVINRAKAEARKYDWLQYLDGIIPDPQPTVFVKPIAAGGKVLSSSLSEAYKLIKSGYGDTLAVEMDGYGFLKAAYANPQVDALVIRGISDLIDNKDSADKAGFQKIASRHASAFAFQILAKLCIEIQKHVDRAFIWDKSLINNEVDITRDKNLVNDDFLGFINDCKSYSTVDHIYANEDSQYIIISINLGIGGVRELGEEWKNTISGIEVEVSNKGKRDALNCEGLVTFKKLDSLTLYPTEKGNVLHNTKKFDLLVGETKTLVAAWGFSGTAIEGSAGFSKGDFVDKTPPIEVIIYYGDKTVRKRLEEEDIDKLIREFEEQNHRLS